MRLSCLTLALALAVSAQAAADPKSDHVARANAAFNAGRYEDALEALNAAIAIESDPQLIFAIGQVHMKLGDCKKAIAFYKDFLATKPDKKEAAVANKAIEHCTTMKPEKKADEKKVDKQHTEKQPEKQPEEKQTEKQPDEPPVNEEPAVVEPPPPAQVEHVPWYRHAFGDVLVLVGVTAAGVAVYEYRSALSHRDAADTAPSYNAYVDELAASQRDRKLAIGFAAGASVFVTAGILRYVLRNSTRERATLSLTPTHGGTLATWSLQF